MAQALMEETDGSCRVEGAEAASRPSRLMGGAAAIVALLTCAVAGLAMWEPGRLLSVLASWVPRPLLMRLNILPKSFQYQPEFSLVLWAVMAAGVLLAATSRGFSLAFDDLSAGAQAAPPDQRAPGPSPVAGTSRLLSAAVALLLLAQVAMWISLSRDYYHRLFVPLWGLGLAAPAVLCRRWNRAAGVRIRFPFSRRECVFLGVLSIAFAAYCSRDLTSWRYSFMGDEFGFWTVANWFIEGRQLNFFAQGVGGYHPMLSSVYQGLFLWLLGPTVFAWRFSSVFAAMAAIPVFYLFLRETISVPAAAAGALLLAGNHYLIAYAHHGLNNVQVVCPTVLALGLWFWGARRRNLLAFYGSGVATGLGFYTFYSSRLTIGFLLLAFLLLPLSLPGRARLRWGAMFLLGFALTVVPLIAVPGDFFGAMLNQSAMASATQPAAGLVARLWTGLTNADARLKWEACLLDPFYSPRQGRFMFGSWVDSWTASLYFLGLVWAAVRWPGHRLLLWLIGCCLASVIAVGVLQQYSFPTDTRMVFLVPFYITFAVLALEVIRYALVRARLLSPRASLAVLGVAVTTALAANQYRFLVVSPERYQTLHYGLVVKIAQTYPPDRHIYFVAPPNYWIDLLKTLADMYGFGDRLELVRTAEIDEQKRDFARPATFVFANMFPEKMEQTIATLRSRYPEGRYEVMQDGPRLNTLWVIDLPAR